MTERTRKTLIFLSLPAVVIWGIMNYSSDETPPPPATESPIAAPDSASIVTPAPAVPQADSRLIDIDAMTTADWGRDPFRCGAAVGQAASAAPQEQLSWILKGIIYNNDAPVAYINNRQVRVGDIVNQARVKEIGRNSVVLDHNGRQITLAVNKG